MSNCTYRNLEEPLPVLRIDDLMVLLDIGRNAAYQLVRSGQIRSIRIGRSIRIPREAVAKFLGGTVA